MKVALIGTRGAPARYGGFETAVEEIGARLVGYGHSVVVYCREPYPGDEHYRGMERVVRPALRHRALETLSHAGLSSLHAIRHRPDVAVMFNGANAPWVTLLRLAGIPVALHMDGHDRKRAKWKGLGQRYYAVANRWGTRAASEVIVDSAAMKAEADSDYGINSTMIAYGAAQTTFTEEQLEERLAALRLRPGGYHLIVARFEPENQVLEMVKGYAASDASLPLVVVGFAGYPGAYSEAIRSAAEHDKRVQLLGAVWNQELLDALFTGCASYLHGHSLGGTNPSLLRAMVHGAPVIGYDCVYNRETTGGAAIWFDDPRNLGLEVLRAEAERDLMQRHGEWGRARALVAYQWSDVALQYDEMIHRLAQSEPLKSQRSSRVA